MGKYFSIYKGKALDYRYISSGASSYLFYIGDILVGRVSKLGGTWGAVNMYTTGKGPLKIPGVVDGFINRHYACSYLLKLNRLHDAFLSEDKEREDMHKRFEERIKQKGDRTWINYRK